MIHGARVHTRSDEDEAVRLARGALGNREESASRSIALDLARHVDRWKPRAIEACGRTPEAAIRALARAKKWGKVSDISDLDGGDGGLTWGRRFWAGGVSFKAAGREVPGGFLLTWWV